MKVCQESRNSEGMRSNLPSQACSFTCPEGTQFSHPSFHSGQTCGSPPTHFIRYPYGGAQKQLRTVVLRQVSSLFLHLPRGHPVQSPFASLRANLRFTIFALSCFVSSQVSALPSQLSLNGPLIPKAAEPAGAHCNWHQHHKKDPAEHFWAAIPVKFARRGARGGLSDNVKAQAMCSAPFAQ